MEFWTGALSWWKCTWPDLKSAGLFRRNLFLTSLNPQHSNPNPNPLAYQLWCFDFLTPPTPLIISHRLPVFLASLIPLTNWCSVNARWSKSSLMYCIRFCGIFPSLKQNFIAYCSSKCPHVQISFLKSTSCDNQALVGCILIAAVAVPYSSDFASCNFCLFPKLKDCRNETIEEMKEALTKVIDTFTHEDFHGAFPKLFER